MPIYEYVCRKCGALTEVFQKMDAKPPAKCGKCGGRLERQISAPAIQFKGSGWYITDYAKKPASGDGKGGTDKKADAGAKDSSSDSAPAPAKDSKDSTPTTAKKD